MKRILFTALLFMAAVAGSGAAFAQGGEPLVYVIKSGDTLWGLSDRFLKDPHYWPDLWAKNPPITNPHFIYPGQKVKVYPDRIVVEGALPEVPSPESAEEPAQLPVPAAAKSPAALVAQAAESKTFTVTGGSGFLMENEIKPSGRIIGTYQNRYMVGDDDIVYTDIGRKQGAKDGDRFSIFKNEGAISHPVTNFIMGFKIIPLGTLQLSEVEEQGSKALVTKSYFEIEAGSLLLPYRDRRKEVALKASNRDLAGYIIETQTGYISNAAGDLVFLDLGSSQGLEVGNMLYIVRDIVPDERNVFGSAVKLPVELLGAVVVVETGAKTSTALIIKSIDTIYPGDRVELKKN
jgi:LysM repeat protein